MTDDDKGLDRRAFIRKGLGAAAGIGIVTGVGFDVLNKFLGLQGDGGDAPFISRVSAQEKKDLIEARYYKKLDENRVRCDLCFRGCNLVEGTIGTCRTLINKGGTLYSMVYGRPCKLQADPIEKEPVFHMLPGSKIYRIGTAGCNFRCKFCQNSEISQANVRELETYTLMPLEVVQSALDNKCASVSFTYNDPIACFEYMFDVATAAREKKLGIVFQSNGSMTAQPLADILPLMNAVVIDLKAFTEKFYKDVSAARLKPVLATLESIRKAGTHLEIVNLVIPTLNDNLDDVKKMCAWICKTLGKDVPLHFNRFSPVYKLLNLPETPRATLDACYGVAKAEGLEYAYVGGFPDHKANCTYCPKCGEKVIDRTHFEVKAIKMKDGKCDSCGTEIPGVWKLA